MVSKEAFLEMFMEARERLSTSQKERNVMKIVSKTKICLYTFCKSNENSMYHVLLFTKTEKLSKFFY